MADINYEELEDLTLTMEDEDGTTTECELQFVFEDDALLEQLVDVLQQIIDSEMSDIDVEDEDDAEEDEDDSVWDEFINKKLED